MGSNESSNLKADIFIYMLNTYFLKVLYYEWLDSKNGKRLVLF